eukprot:TRINITY_DN9564_c0_g1_i2.p1 TRINITY_DN9564_c0_g1~~TRINITY_DN9564_c0_g1_i2.p1  ORF type:complete len:490 (+),score=83.70 TRINITY_DN9564_c0_g1_i2:170-1639(+)
MGNNAVTGHAVNLVAQSNPSQFHQTLGLTMRQGNIAPWDPKSLVDPVLQRQKMILKNTPFRFINAGEGMLTFAPYSGAWVQNLSRERFVQLAQEMFKNRNMALGAADTRVFYDVFDALDLYGNASLSPGELIGLASFFNGTQQDIADAVFGVLDPQHQNVISKDAVKQFVTPYVWAMVPESAAVLRPMFVDYVTDDIFHEMDMARTNAISQSDLYRWFQYGRPRAEVQAAAIAGGVELDLPSVADVISSRVASSMQVALQVSMQTYEIKNQVKQYAVQSYQATHNGQMPPVRDVGVYRYVEQNIVAAPAAPVVQPQIWTHVQKAGDAIAYHATTAGEALGNLYTSYTRGRADSTASAASVGTIRSVYQRRSTVGGSEIQAVLSQPTYAATSTVLPPAPPAPQPAAQSSVQVSVPPLTNNMFAPRAAPVMFPQVGGPVPNYAPHSPMPTVRAMPTVQYAQPLSTGAATGYGYMQQPLHTQQPVFQFSKMR